MKGQTMQVHLTPPLSIRTALGTPYELLPVIMDKLPSWKAAVFTGFLKPQAKRIALPAAELQKVQAYMRQYSTEAVTEDGIHALTVADDGLIECLPDLVEELFTKEGATCQPG